MQFNLSHTRGAVLVGIHDRPIGVDIERIRPVSERTMQRLAGAVTEREFFESWTRRESRAKRGGAGLAAMKREASPTMLGERFEYIETFPGYVACVCTHTDDALAPVRRFTLGEEQQRLLNKQQELQILDNQLAQELMQEQQNLNEQLRDTVVSQLKAFNLGRGYQVVFFSKKLFSHYASPIKRSKYCPYSFFLNGCANSRTFSLVM